MIIIANFIDVIIIYKGEETNYFMYEIEIIDSFWTPSLIRVTKA